jgi:hypothetical protein
VLPNYPLNVSWRRDLIGPILVAWNNLLSRIANLVLTQDQDKFHWNLTQNGEFSVKSHYLALVHSDLPNINKVIWKLKILLKVKIFLWYLCRGVVLTRDNLAKRNWQGSKNCCFCHKDETILHLFYECRFARFVWCIIQVATGLFPPRSVSNMFGNWLQGIRKDLKSLILLGVATICWTIWLCRNNMVFDKRKISSHLHIIFLNFLLPSYLGNPSKTGSRIWLQHSVST